MTTLLLKPLATNRIQNGHVCIQKDDLVNDRALKEGEDVTLVSGKTKAFIGKAITGFQHKGIGWVYTTKQHETFNEAFVVNVFQQAFHKRQAMNLQTTAYRLFNGESDGIGGVTIDWYNDSAVFSWYSAGIYRYQEMIINAFLKSCLQQPRSIFEKLRFQNAPCETQWVYGDSDDKRVIIENGIHYATYLNDGLMTGIFLDQRDVRHYLLQNSRGQSVLNTFSYTAAFSLASACGNASQTTSVDVAKRSIEKSTEHFALNNVAVDDAHKFYVMDVFDYFKYAQKKALTFDWVILDPPSFARTKKRTFSVLKNYGELLADAIKVTKMNGRIVVSTNASNFTKEMVETMIQTTFQNMRKAFIIEQYFTQAQDFTTHPNEAQTAYLKVFIVKVVAN